MPPHRERHWPWVVAGYALLFAVIAAATGYFYDSAAPANQATVIRLAVGFVVGVLLIHIRAYFRGDPRWDPPAAFEDALVHQPVAAGLDLGFVKLRDDLASASVSRSFFDKLVWPRLRTLARARGQQGDIEPPAARVWPRRGPSRRTIAAMIDHIEDLG